MFRKLLHLYNDGHIPFPNMKGQGFGVYINPSHPDREEIGYYADDTMTQEEADAKNQGLNIIKEELFPTDNEQTVQTKEEYEREKYLDEYFKELDEKNDALNLQEILNDVDYDDELYSINEEIKEIKRQEKIKLKGKPIEQHEKDLLLLEQEEKAERKKIVINNLQKKKYIDSLILKAESDSDKFYMSMRKKGSKYEKLVQEHAGLFLDEINEYDEDSLTDKDLLSEVMKFAKITNAKLNEVIPMLIHYNGLFIKNDKIEKVTREYLQFVNDRLLRIAYKDEFKVVKKLEEDNEQTLKRIEELKSKMINTKMRVTYVQVGREEIKEHQKRYNELKKIYDAQDREREAEVITKLEKFRKKIDDTHTITKAEAEEVKELLAEAKQTVNKVKKEKPIKKSEEEKQAELSNVNISNRLQHVQNDLSEYGKALETYLTKQGSVILQHITGDKSQIYDNELNKEIPDIIVTLNDGKQESLRKAVTLDLYSNENVFEVKNYKQYSINDAVIPLQETKLEGTYYFKPLYLKDGKLYNIELTYSDSSGEHTKYILPENPAGRELILIYRLKEGLFRYNPMSGPEVKLKHTTNKTPEGKDLYVFKNAKYNKCVDHHNNPSFNIRDFLTPIKI
jgi:hypothetical protein